MKKISQKSKDKKEEKKNEHDIKKNNSGKEDELRQSQVKEMKWKVNEMM